MVTPPPAPDLPEPKPMKNQPTLSRLFQAVVAALVSAGPVAQAQTALSPPASRITDAAISADQRGYEAMQARLKALNDGGRPLRDHHLAKAQCWLDTSFHEYTRNDRGPWPQAALSEAEKLVQALEKRQLPLPDETPLIAGAQRIRPDLWQRAAQLRSHAGWPCAQARAACAEVELVHAGHELAQIGWRHARPYVQIAEDLLGEADALAAACVPAPAPAPLPVPSPVVVVPPPAPAPAPVIVTVREPAELRVMAGLVFRFDKHGQADITGAGLAGLDAALQQMAAERLQLQAVHLSGHADRLKHPRQAAYNQELSERRVRTVREMLVARGIPADRINTVARGDQVATTSCNQPQGAALKDCLLPDRRVEVQFVFRRP
ncbi:MAG: hypothetical protein RJA10_548 [Pseudomonadota bacterium]|jgi:outer membrane protein OmpA-like peptidoglycan-associated protein